MGGPGPCQFSIQGVEGMLVQRETTSSSNDRASGWTKYCLLRSGNIVFICWTMQNLVSMTRGTQFGTKKKVELDFADESGVENGPPFL